MRSDRRKPEAGLIRDSHTPLRNALRVVGPVVFLIGAGFMAVGLVDFFGAMAHSMRSGPTFGHDPAGTPDKFWCLFVGMPLLALGGWLTAAGFMGAVARYAASEAAPVGKDTFNYMAEGTQDGVRTVVRSVAAGLRDGADPPGGAGDAALACPGCDAVNDAGSKFCDQCGQALPGDTACPSCQTRNDPDARFCDACGAELPR